MSLVQGLLKPTCLMIAVEVNVAAGDISAATSLRCARWESGIFPIRCWLDGWRVSSASARHSRPGRIDDQVDAWSQGAKRLLTVTTPKRTPQYVPLREYGDRSWMV